MSGSDAETQLKSGRPQVGRDPKAKPCVEIQSGAGQGTRIVLDVGTHVIGRGTAADVRIDDEGVSREHAKLVITEEMVNLLDLQSTNGTYVNGAPVDVAVVREGDRIHVGPDVMLRFAYRDPDAPVEAAPEPPPRPPEETVPLSPRELEVARHVAEGLTNAAIGKRLHISPRTVTTHLVKIYEKLDLHSRTALTRYILERNLHQ